MSNIAKSYILALSFILLTNNVRYGIVTVTLGGISPIRSIRGLFTWMKHAMNIPPYVYRKFRQNYVHAATNDDLQLNRFIFLDLYSTKHYKDIKISELPDDPENEWQNIRLYEMSPNAHKSRNDSSISSASSTRTYNPNDDVLLTIGCVYYYAQTLQCKLNYDTRKVMTYLDAQKRFCVHIESYDSSGFVKSKRIFREKKKSWWLKMLLNEEVTVTSMVLSGDVIARIGTLMKSVRSQPEDLDIPSRTVPKFMIGRECNLGYIYYNTKKDAGVSNLRSIIFRNEPVQLENIGNILNICIFNYANAHKQTDFIVICQEEKGEPYKCTFYKCLSHADKHYELVDSFTTSSPRITLEECTYDVTDSKRNTIVLKHSKDSLLPSNIDNLLTIIYLDCNHFIIRPVNVKTAPLIKSIDINDATGHKTLEAVRPQGTFISIQQSGPTFQRLSIATTGNSSNSHKTLFVCPNDAKKGEEFNYEVHMRTMISTMPSPYLLSKSAISKPITQGYRLTFYDEERIVAKLNDKTTFFAHNFGRGEYKFLQSIDFDGVSLETLPNINSQVLYCQTESKKFVVLSQAYNAPKTYQLDGDKFVEATGGDSRNLLENADLADFIGTPINPDKWTEITLNFNDVVLSEDVDVLILSSDATLYTTSYGYKITRIIWGASTIKLDGGWTQVTRITTNTTKYLLVDMLDENKAIRRQLYEYETSDDSNELGKLRLVSKSDIDDLNKTNLDETRLKIQNSYYDIIPNLPGIFADFNDARLEHDEFGLNKLSIIYSGSGSKLTIGDFEGLGRKDEVNLEHKWRQVFMNKHSDQCEYKVFTLTRRGISSTQITKSEIKKYLLPFNSELPQLRADTIPLIIDSLNMSNVKITKSNLGGTEIITFKAAENRKINPVIFGNHEIRLLGETVVTVTKATVDGLSHITIEDEGDTNRTLQFEQSCKGSGEYKLCMEGDTVFIPFVDMKGLHAPMIDSVTFPGENGTRPENSSDTNGKLIKYFLCHNAF